MNYPKTFSKRKMLPALLALIFGIGLSFSSCGKSSDNEEASLPLRGIWENPDGNYRLVVNYDNFTLEDTSSDLPESIIARASITREDNNNLSFSVEDKHPGTIIYNPYDKTVKIKIKGLLADGSDYSRTLNSEDRLDLVTPHEGTDQVIIKLREDKSIVDTLYRGESLRWVCDTLLSTIVMLPDGRLCYADKNYFQKTRSTLPEKVFERDYQYKKYNDYVETIYFNRKGDKVGIGINYMNLDGSGAFESYFLGELKGTEITVNKKFDDPMDYLDGKFSAATPLDEPFTIYVIDTDKPRVVKDGKNYHVATF